MNLNEHSNLPPQLTDVSVCYYNVSFCKATSKQLSISYQNYFNHFL